MKERFVCELSDIEDPGSLGFTGESPGDNGIFLVRQGERVFAWRNSCPHTGAPLEWQENRFLDFSGKLIQCALHGALFEIDSGNCIRGPCVNEALQPLPLKIENGRIYLIEQ